jgi:hypothetical protein
MFCYQPSLWSDHEVVHAEHRFPEELLDQVNAIVWKSTPASKNPCLRSGKGRNACGKKRNLE